MEESTTTDQILKIIQKPYQQRTPRQHANLINILQSNIESINTDKDMHANTIYFSIKNVNSKFIKLMTFFLQAFEGEKWILGKQYSTESILINSLNYTGDNFRAHKFIVTDHTSKILIEKGSLALFLDGRDYRTCVALGQTSIEKQLSFFQSSEYFQPMLKRRHLFLMRNCTVEYYSYGQSVYRQGDKLQNSSSNVYLVRSGQFAYKKYIQNEKKSIEVCIFGQGHLFGGLQVIERRKDPQNKTFQNRPLTVVCKSSKGVVYKFNEQIFLSQIKPYCESILMAKQRQFTRFVSDRSNKVKEGRATQNNFLIQQRRKSKSDIEKYLDSNKQRKSLEVNNLPGLKAKFSQQLNLNLTPETLNTGKKISHYNLHNFSRAVQSQIGFGTSRPSLGSSFVGKLTRSAVKSSQKTRRLSSQDLCKPQQKQSQFNQMRELLEKKQRLTKLREKIGQSHITGRGEVLFGLFKKSWQAQKEKKFKRSRKTLY